MTLGCFTSWRADDRANARMAREAISLDGCVSHMAPYSIEAPHFVEGPTTVSTQVGKWEQLSQETKDTIK